MSSISEGTRRTTIEHLARQLRGLERCRGRSVPDAGCAPVSTGVEALDRLFPGGGLCGGVLVECLAEDAGSGARTLAFVLARRFAAAREGEHRWKAESRESRVESKDEHRTLNIDHRTSNGEPRVTNDLWTASGSRLSTLDSRPILVIDLEGEFYPPAAAGLGIDLNETIVVRPADRHEALWALEQSLRCPGVGVTLAWLDRNHRLDSQACRRLALAAETGGGLGLLLRPAACQRDPSGAHVRLLVQPRAADHGLRTTHHSALTAQSSLNRRLHIHLLRGRKGHVAESLELELRDEPPDPVHLAAPLANPASARRATGT